MFIKHRCVETIEQVIPLLFVLFEQLQVFEDSLLDRHLVVVANGILSEKIKHNHALHSVQFFMKRHMLVTKRAAADGVSLILVLLVTCKTK